MTSATTPGFAFETDRGSLPGLELAKQQPVTTVLDPTEAASLAGQAVVFGPRAEIVQPVPSESEAAADDAATNAEQDFPTLAAAVAAQAHPETIDDELTCLAIGVYFESKGEPLAGQLAVADVIINRSESGRFPKSICSVLKQRGQFSFVRGGRLPRVDTGSRNWRTALAVAQVAKGELWDSPAPEALYFHARYVSPRWKRARVASVGNHIFYR